eukprot:SAG31_NODE_16056_length_725_cov_0.846645_3_plen_32_part_01
MEDTDPTHRIQQLEQQIGGFLAEAVRDSRRKG